MSKLFVQSFYRANAGFFLAVFFIFFGSVDGGTLLSYHLSLMKSITGSAVIFGFVLFGWLLYATKCMGYFFKNINAPEGSFLHALQALNKVRQGLLYSGLFLAVYAPVLVYSLVFSAVALSNEHGLMAAAVLLFQALVLCGASAVLLHRLNNWIDRPTWPALRFAIPKSLELVVAWHFLTERKTPLLLLKTSSLALLYAVLVWNGSHYSHDSFLLFYLVILLLHSPLPYLSVQFVETRFAVLRNLPAPLFRRLLLYLLPYFIFLLPEFLYMFFHATAFSPARCLAYFLNAVAGQLLLTAMLYSGTANRKEYIKATFVLFFVSIFTLHAQAFWTWISVQLGAALFLFFSGYHTFETAVKQPRL